MKAPEVKVEVAGDKFSYQIRTGYTYNRAVFKISGQCSRTVLKSFERSLKGA